MTAALAIVGADPVALVICPRCKRDLHPGAFWKNKNSPTGRQHYCIECLRAAKRGPAPQTTTVILDGGAGVISLVAEVKLMKLSARDRVLVGVLADAMRARAGA